MLTGNPANVGMDMEMQKYLEDGDSVEVEISEFGTDSNKGVFER